MKMKMKIINTVREFQATRKEMRGRLGFVPTMGALHAGHVSLMERAKEECDIVVASIFVNPTQFNDKKDLETYPNTLEADLHALENAGVDFLFMPNYSEVYLDDYRYEVREKELSKTLCGKVRPGHFDGVLSVVMKLFNIVRPTCAYFGEKDYQQYLLIKGMCEAFFLEIEIIPCPLVREADGLAMSSRNLKLDSTARQLAPLFYRELSKCKNLHECRLNLERAGFVVDYLEEEFGRRFGAVFLGKVRLIDNVQI